MNWEPRTVINDERLTDAQAATVRVALEHFASSLHEEGLGDDAHGKQMVQLYLARIEEVRNMIFK